MFGRIVNWFAGRVADVKDDAAMDAAAVQSAAHAAPAPSGEDAMIEHFEAETNGMDDERHERDYGG